MSADGGECVLSFNQQASIFSSFIFLHLDRIFCVAHDAVNIYDENCFSLTAAVIN